jgi:hypothetical protein
MQWLQASTSNQSWRLTFATCSWCDCGSDGIAFQKLSEEGQSPRVCDVQEYERETKCSFWVAVDGSKFQFGDIDTEEEYYHPDGDKLFDDDDDPDDENYEGYTGNAGAHVCALISLAVVRMHARQLYAQGGISTVGLVRY